ncbi:MAG: hypothetical protein F7C34_04820 [Desulfurococcales archaeon]|nr:hypothetical protein [Desulfurococcales archaeon]
MLSRKNKVILLLVLIVTVAVAAQAGVLVINLLTTNVNYTGAPLKFEAGTNAGNNGINGTAITVDIGHNGATANLTFDVPPGTTYVIDALRIKNYGTSDLYFQFKTITAPDTTMFTNVSLILLDTNGNIIGTYDVINGTSSLTYFTIGAGTEYIVAIKFVSSSGWTTGATTSFGVELQYSTNANELNYGNLG